MVSDELGITNGHAARMRFSRFKQHMEGVPPTPRKTPQPRSKRPRTEKHKYEPKGETALNDSVKAENDQDTEPMLGLETSVKPECAEETAALKREESGTALHMMESDHIPLAVHAFESTTMEDASTLQMSALTGRKESGVVKREPRGAE